jgi:sulfate adenylyltransferase subunit 1 (EFTu-like GTPase family)
MSEILIDAITNVTVAGGLIRVDCVATGPNNQQRPSGTLLIPGPQAGPVITALVNAMKELQRKQQEQAESAVKQ